MAVFCSRKTPGSARWSTTGNADQAHRAISHSFNECDGTETAPTRTFESVCSGERACKPGRGQYAIVA